MNKSYDVRIKHGYNSIMIANFHTREAAQAFIEYIEQHADDAASPFAIVEVENDI